MEYPACGADLLNPSIRVQAFLSNVPLFRELGSDELDRVALNTQLVHAAKGEILFRRGDPALGFYIVIFGQVKLAFSSPRGDEKVVDLNGPGQSFGEAVMFMERPHVVTAQALSDSMLLYVGREVVFEELERDPKFARRMIAGLSIRLHGLVSDLENDSLHSGTQRVIGYLLRDSEDNPEFKGALKVTLSISKGVIASRLSLTQVHFSRILHDLSVRGLIEVHGRSIDIPDVAKLRACSD